MRTILLCVFVVAIVNSGSCQPKGTEPGKPSKLISCGGDAIAHCAIDLLGPVNECLSGAGDIVACMVGFAKPLGCTAVDYVACLVRKEGSAAAAAARANPDDVRDKRRAERAHEYLERIGARFAPDPMPAP